MGLFSAIGSALTGGLSDLAGMALGNYYNKKEAKRARNFELDMWNKQNEYDTPSNQMARLKAAGLNPNLVYGSGSVVGNTSHAAPKYTMPDLDFSGVANAASNMLNTRQRNLNIEQQKITNETLSDQNKADIKVKNATVARINAEARAIERENRVMGTGTKFESSSKDSTLLRNLGRGYRELNEQGISNWLKKKFGWR